MPHCVFLSHPQSRDSGDYQHRVTLPARALARHWSVEDLQTSHPRFVERALRADLLIVCMVAEPVIARLVQARNAAGRPTAYEISDDFEHFPSSLPGHAFYSLPQTRRVIAELAAAYIRRHKLEDQSVRIDVVAVTFPAAGRPVVEHYQNAFESPW